MQIRRAAAATAAVTVAATSLGTTGLLPAEAAPDGDLIRYVAAAGGVWLLVGMVVLLAGGERMLAALARGIRRLLPRPAAPTLVPRAPRVRALAPLPVTLPTLPPFSLSRRGPPALAR